MTNLNIIDAFERQLYGKKLGNENKYKKKVDRKPDIINPHEYYNEGELYCNKK